MRLFFFCLVGGRFEVLQQEAFRRLFFFEDHVTHVLLVDLSSNSDYYIHSLCRQKSALIPELKEFLLSDDKIYDSAGKLNRLKELLPQLKAGGHRVLVFSQMTKMLDILGN